MSLCLDVRVLSFLENYWGNHACRGTTHLVVPFNSSEDKLGCNLEVFDCTNLHRGAKFRFQDFLTHRSSHLIGPKRALGFNSSWFGGQWSLGKWKWLRENCYYPMYTPENDGSSKQNVVTEPRRDAKLANPQICTFYYINTSMLPGKSKLRNKYNRI